MIKVYGIAGKTCANIKLNVGKATLPLDFTKGCLDRKNYRPATFSTEDPTVQAMIEDSPLFGKVITIYRVYGTAEPAAPKVVSEAKKEEVIEVASFPGVTTFEEAVAKLKSLGAKATNLNSVANMKKYMANKNIEFPNYEF